MGKSKKDLGRYAHTLKIKIEELELKAKMDPLRKHPEVHEELDKLKRKLLEAG